VRLAYRVTACVPTITVLAAPQTCRDVSATTAFDTALSINTDCSGAEPATLAIKDAPAHGTATVVDGKLRYTPAAGYIGSDQFTYTTTNEGGASNTAKATVRVLAPPPVCDDAAATTPYETRVDISIHCTRPGGIAIKPAPAHGTAFNAEGGIRYTPDAAKALRLARQSRSAVVFVKPLKVPQIRKAVSAVGLLPPKSTYFYPKVATGLVFKALDGGA